MINRVRCHEHGCPNGWTDTIRECKWCGKKFKPYFKHMTCCCHGCADVYFGGEGDCIGYEYRS